MLLTPRIETDVAPDLLRQRLVQWEPWHVLLEFSNGVSTAEFKRQPYFAQGALFHIKAAESHIPFERMRGGRVLDVGCMVGYTSIYLAQEFGMRPVGIDVVPEFVEAASYLGQVAGIEGEFHCAHAESFVRPSAFDLVAHFGTLYHLQNPLRSLRASYESLRPGGYLALETHCYDDPADERLGYFIHGLNDDPTNFFAFSSSTIRSCLSLAGFEQSQEFLRQPETTAAGRPHMFRVGFVARKGNQPPPPWPRWAD